MAFSSVRPKLATSRICAEMRNQKYDMTHKHWNHDNNVSIDATIEQKKKENVCEEKKIVASKTV